MRFHRLVRGARHAFVALLLIALIAAPPALPSAPAAPPAHAGTPGHADGMAAAVAHASEAEISASPADAAPALAATIACGGTIRSTTGRRTADEPHRLPVRSRPAPIVLRV